MKSAQVGSAAVTSGTRPWRALIAVLPFLLAVTVVVAVFQAVRDRMPEPLAVHFTGGGTGDGFATTSDFLTMCVGLPVVLGALIGALVLRNAAAGVLRWAIGGGYAMAGLFGSLSVSTLLVNADAGDASAVRLPLTHLGVALGVAALGAAVGWLCAGRDRVRADKVAGPSQSAPPLALADGETVGWSRSVGSPVLVVLGPGLLAVGAVFGFAVHWAGAVAFAFAGLTCLVFASVRVTADRRGLTVASPVVPRPRLRIPLTRMEEAGVQYVRPLADFGGWGYRIAAGRSGIVLRAGEALALRLTDGRVFMVTVDDAATAAALLNALAARTADPDSATGPGSGGGAASDSGQGS
ncbi:hypothetical protein [Streptomyces sp. NPDC059788]|uniref:hypothetical protein n=1 Tax=Streptomyces sp. NPDC059788 TaxID=3346948 RepID=UPI0036481935